MVGWLWYLGLLVPVIGLVHVGQQSMADRYTYLPLVGVFILLAWSAADALARWPRLKLPLSALAAVSLAACCALSNAQVRLWASTKTLFAHTVAVTESNPVALTNLGLAEIKEDRLADAERILRESLKLDPNGRDAWGNLASVYRKQKKFDDALNACRMIDRLCPGDAKCLGLMADIYEDEKHHAEAENCLRRALKAEPASTVYRIHLAQVFQADGKAAEALDVYLSLVRDRPSDANIRNNAAWILATSADSKLRNGGQAIELLLPAANSTQVNANLLDTLAAAYAAAGQFDRAIQAAERAISKAREESAAAGAIDDMEKRLALYKKRRPYREGK